MSVAVVSRLDFSIVNAARVRRLASSPGLDEKLTLLRRLVRRDVDGTLPRMTETSAEQSWNEQLFARVLDYQTLFSHDSVPFHLRPKGYAGGSYDDFSLGFFGGHVDRVVATAELKAPGTALDAAQGKKYKRRTPVEQAHYVANNIALCRWVLVSNFVELRLYARGDADPLARVFLTEVRSRRDLAALLAHFDRRALLGPMGRGTEDGEMAQALTIDHEHPGAVLAPIDGRYRMVARFTPQPERELPLFEAETRLRLAMKSTEWARFIEQQIPGLSVNLAIRLKDGWVAVEGSNKGNKIAIRIAASLSGQIQVSASIAGPRINHQTVDRMQVDVGWLFAVVRRLMWVVGVFEPPEGIAQLSSAPDAGGHLARGLVSAELREVNGAYLSAATLHDPSTTGAGLCALPDVHAGEFRLIDGNGAAVIVKCVRELAAHFRDASGGVGLDGSAALAYVNKLGLRA